MRTIRMNNSCRNSEREQRVALCVMTYYNLYGKIPSSGELLRMLGRGYTRDVMMYFAGADTRPVAEALA